MPRLATLQHRKVRPEPVSHQHGNILLITGQKKTEPKPEEMLHQGLASRNFKQTFNLADHVKVTSAEVVNGLLLIELIRDIPE